MQAAERSRDLLDRHVADHHVHLDHPELVGLLLLVVVAPGLADGGVGGGEPEGDGLPEHLPVEGLQRGLLLQRVEQHGARVRRGVNGWNICDISRGKFELLPPSPIRNTVKMTITAENVLFHIEIFGSQNIWACQMSIWFQSLLFYVTTSIKVKVLYEILYLPLQFPNCYDKSGSSSWFTFSKV